MLTRQPWYVRFDPHPEGTNCFDRTQANSAACSQSYENTTIFLVSLGQFLIAAFVFNKGPPFRRPIYTNLWLLLGEAARGGGPRQGGARPASRAMVLPAHSHGPSCSTSQHSPSCAPLPSPCTAMSFQTALLGFLILAPSTPVTHDFAGAPPGQFSQACLPSPAWAGAAM